MSEVMTETPTTTTEGSTASEAPPATLLSSTAPTGTQTQPGETAKERPVKETPAAETKPEGAPEKYEFKAPEGKEYDAAVLEPFSEAAKEANLSQDAAQKLLEKMAPALAARQEAQVQAVQAGWMNASKVDTEFGGDKLQENLGVAKKAADTFASKDLRTLLDTTGLGNHPEVIRLFFKIGKSISEDGFVNGQAASGQKRDLTAILYDNTAK